MRIQLWIGRDVIKIGILWIEPSSVKWIYQLRHWSKVDYNNWCRDWCDGGYMELSKNFSRKTERLGAGMPEIYIIFRMPLSKLTSFKYLVGPRNTNWIRIVQQIDHLQSGHLIFILFRKISNTVYGTMKTSTGHFIVRQYHLCR